MLLHINLLHDYVNKLKFTTKNRQFSYSKHDKIIL